MRYAGNLKDQKGQGLIFNARKVDIPLVRSRCEKRAIGLYVLDQDETKIMTKGVD